MHLQPPLIRDVVRPRDRGYFVGRVPHYDNLRHKNIITPMITMITAAKNATRIMLGKPEVDFALVVVVVVGKSF